MMKRHETIRKLYSLKGAVNETEFAKFKTDLFANGVANSIELTGANTDALLISGINTDAIHISGNNTASAVHISGTQITGILIGACTTGVSIAGACTTGFNLTGNATSGFKITSGTVVNAIEIGDASAVTNLFKFNELAGCIQNTDVDPVYDTSAGGLGADACIVIDIAGSDYYIPIFAVSLS